MTNKEVELTEACKAALELIKIARKYFPQSIHNDDRFSLELANSILTTALKVK